MKYSGIFYIGVFVRMLNRRMGIFKGNKVYFALRHYCRGSISVRDELVRAYFTMQLIIATMFVVFIFLTVNIVFHSMFNVIIDLLILLVLALTFLLLRLGYFKFAKIFLVTFINLGVFVIASGHGRGAGYQFLWFVIMGGVFLLFSFKQLTYAILSIGISFGFLLLTEFTDFRLIDNPNNTPEFSSYKYYVCLFTGISMILFYLFYYMRLYFDSENKLRKFIDKLTKRNSTLRKTNSELDSFVYRASHDLRAPLASLMALVKLSKEETDKRILEEYIHHQEKAIQKLDAYIVDILNLSKNSRKDIDIVPVNLKNLFEDLLSQYAFLENYEQIQKIIEIEEIIPLYTDQKRLIIVLNNLISNALRYSDHEKKHRYIELRATIDKSRAIVYIKDNGVGIEKKHLDKVFQMFYRASHSSEGSGLGLYLVHETVLKLGGHVSVNSEEKGWTEFTIILPNLISR